MGKVDYRTVETSVIGSLLYKGMCVEFVIDAADLSGVQAYKWHYSNNYISTSVTVDVDVSGTTVQKKRWSSEL
jgi:hypothetical protein